MRRPANRRIRIGLALLVAVTVLAGPGGAAAGEDPVPAGNAVLSGVVLRGPDGMPEVGHTVRLFPVGGPDRETTTDAWGGFTFHEVLAGQEHALLVEAEGCAPVRIAGIVLVPWERREVGALRLDEPGPVVARVSGSDGEPIAGATIEVFREAAGAMAHAVEGVLPVPARPVATAVADEEGVARFELPRSGSFSIAARAEGRARFAFARVSWYARDSIELDFELPPARRLTGRVVGPDGTPVPGARVATRRHISMIGRCGTCDPPHVEAGLWQHATADEAGRFAVDSLPPGAIEVVAAGPERGFAHVATLDFPALEDVELALRPTGTITGRVTDAATGAPVAHAVVAAESGYVSTSRIAATDPNGRYRLEGVPASDEVRVSLYAPDGWTLPRRKAVRTVRLLGGQRLELDDSLVRAAVVEGRVLLDGEPVPGASVSVVTLPAQPGRWVPARADGRADASGRYRVDGVLPGFVGVTAVAPGDSDYDSYQAFLDSVSTSDGRDRVGFDVAAGAVAARDVEIARFPPHEIFAPPTPEPPRPPAGVLHLRVKGPDGAPPELAWATFDDEARELADGRVGYWPPLDFPRRVPAGGVLDVPWPEGTESFSVAVHDALRDLTAVKRVAVPAGARELDLEVVLHERPALRGRVVSGGEPVAGAWISWNGRIGARSGPDGSFALRVPTGGWRIRAWARGFVPWTEYDVVVPDPDGKELVLDLDPAAALAGRVLDSDGRPLEGVVLCAAREEGKPATVSDADGCFRVEGLVPGLVRLAVSRPAGDLEEFETDLFETGRTDLEIRARPGFAIAGAVLGPDGIPRPDSRITCLAPGENPDDAPERRTDDSGRFRFDGLAAGDHVLAVRPPFRSGLMPARIPVDAGTGEVSIRLDPASEISGFVVDADGKPIDRNPIAAVRLDESGPDEPEWPWDLEDWTSDDGSFRIEVPPGARFRLEFRDSARAADRGVLAGGEDVASGTTGLRLFLDPGIRIAGIVVDPGGRPLARASVEVRTAPSAVKRDYTGPDGLFAVGDLEEWEEAEVVVTSDGLIPVRLTGVAAGTTDLEIVLRPGLKITGRLLDADGARPRGWVVRALRPDEPEVDLWRARPDDEGRFELRGLTEGEWLLEAIVPGCMEVGDRVSLGTWRAGERGVVLRLPR